MNNSCVLIQNMLLDVWGTATVVTRVWTCRVLWLWQWYTAVAVLFGVLMTLFRLGWHKVAVRSTKIPASSTVVFASVVVHVSRVWLSYKTPSVLWYCWLDIRKSIWPVKNWVMRCGRGYLSGVRCKWFALWCHCHPIIYCLIKIQNGLTFSVLAYLGCPGKEAV